MGCICKSCNRSNCFICSLTLLCEEDPFARSWPHHDNGGCGGQGHVGLLFATLGWICKYCTSRNSFIYSLTLHYEEDPFARSWPPSRRWRRSAAPLPRSWPRWLAASRTHHKAACLKVCVTRHSTVQHYQDHAATCIYAWATSSQRDPNHLKTIIFVV